MSNTPEQAAPEYYIRGPNDTEARGPFTVEQLASLAETGQLDSETLYYDAAVEQWALLGSNEELRTAIFPQKKKLVVKAKENVKALNVQKEEHKAITVEQMLAAAEGRTEDTKDKRDPLIEQGRCAKIGMFSALLMCLLSAASLILPHIDIVMSADVGRIVKQPGVLFGLVDVICVVFLALGVAAMYPLIRFRAALGAGYFALIFWLQDQPTLALAVAAGSAGLYFSTVFLSYIPTIAAALVGIGGMGLFAYHLIMVM